MRVSSRSRSEVGHLQSTLIHKLLDGFESTTPEIMRQDLLYQTMQENQNFNDVVRQNSEICKKFQTMLHTRNTLRVAIGF